MWFHVSERCIYNEKILKIYTVLRLLLLMVQLWIIVFQTFWLFLYLQWTLITFVDKRIITLVYCVTSTLWGSVSLSKWDVNYQIQEENEKGLIGGEAQTTSFRSSLILIFILFFTKDARIISVVNSNLSFIKFNIWGLMLWPSKYSCCLQQWHLI